MMGFGRFRIGFRVGGRIVGGGLPAGFTMRRGGGRRRLLRGLVGIATAGHGSCRRGRSHLGLREWEIRKSPFRGSNQ